MRSLIRPVAVLLTFFLLQLVLVESGYACGMSMDGASGGESMPGMQMPGDANDSSRTPVEGGEQQPCRFPWAPNGCQLMAPCAPSALTVSPSACAPVASTLVAVAELIVLAPPSFSRAPELPPPRA